MASAATASPTFCETGEVTQAAEDGWVETILGFAGAALANLRSPDCMPGYQNTQEQQEQQEQ